MRGYNFNVGDAVSAINLDILEKNFKSGDVITPEILVEKRIVRRVDGKAPKVKILGNGEIKITLSVSNCQVSKSAKEKIEKAGGSVKIREAKVEKKEVKAKKVAKIKK